jgi:thiamine biosynthesis protein ThiS
MPIIKEGILMLLDAALYHEDIKKITNLIESKKETANYHNLQTRESGSHIFVSVHIVFNVSISLYDAHLISDKLELNIKRLFENKKVHVLVHMDPYDDSQINEIEDFYKKQRKKSMKLIINGETKEFDKNITLAKLLQELNLTQRVMAAAVNMEIIKQAGWETHELKDEDKIELLDFVGGG